MRSIKARYGVTVDVDLLAATATWSGASGRQLILAELVGTCDIKIYDARRQEIGSASGIRVGYDVWIPDGFTAVQITASTAQTAKLIVSDEPMRYNRITGSIEASSAPLNTLTHGGSAAVDTVGITITPPAGTKAIQLTGDPANTDMIWPSGTAGQGTPVQAGTTISWPTGVALNPVAGSGTQSLYWTIFGE